ncbi:MAG: DUF1659 domain-containing protein [Clostridiaceae bacterium]
MAVTATKTDCSMVLKFVQGVDEFGRDIIKSQKFSNLKTTALDQDIYDVAMALETLMPDPLVEILKNDENALASE